MTVANYLGDVSNPTGGFRNSAGVLADPTTVVLKVKDPAQIVSTPAPTKDATGLYHADVDTTGKPGLWTYEWIGTGNVQAINAKQFKTIPPPL